MKKHLLPQKGNFYKANMHCHSNWSDGTYSPAELKKLYKEQGYSVLAITDHEGLFYHSELDDENFLTIPSCEYEFNEKHGEDFDNWIVCHLCVYKKDKSDIYQIGVDHDYFHPKFTWMSTPEMKKLIKSKGEILIKDHTPEAINTAIKRLREDGFVVTYNHPHWSRENYPIYSKYTGMNNLEIFNTGCYIAGHDDNNGDIYDDLLLLGEKPFCVAADDNHSGSDMFGGFIMLAAESLTYENIMSAFENGEFYSSRGPLLSEIFFEDGKFTIKSSTPLKTVRFHTGRRHVGAVNGEELYEASFMVQDDDKYVRAEAIDKDGKIAYTQAYFIDDMKN